MDDPHRGPRTRVIAVVTGKFTAPHVIDEVIGFAVGWRHLDHVKPPVQAEFLYCLRSAPLNRHLGLQRRIQLQARWWWWRFGNRLKRRASLRSRSRLTLWSCVRRQLTICRRLGERRKSEGEQN